MSSLPEYILRMLILEYKKVDNKHGCCISNSQLHQYCVCGGLGSICKTACDDDINCRGYAGLTKGVCLIATTSDCSIDCALQIGNGTGELKDGATCGPPAYSGCFIKQG